MYLQIITPEKSVFNGEVEEVLAPTLNGQIGILPHHINLVTSLTDGELIIKIKDREKLFGLTGGFLEVKDSQITILADYAAQADEVNTQVAEAAKKRAEEIIKNKADQLPQEDLRQAQAELRRALLDLHIAGSHKKRHNR